MPRFLRILLLSFAGGAFSAIILRRGLLATEDSWAYWETSVSILERGRYTYLDGQPFLMEPPGISLCWALTQALFGTTGAGLIISVCVFNALSIGLWLLFLEKVFQTAGLPLSGLNFWVAAIFVTAFVPLSCYVFVPNIALLPLIAVVFILTLRAATVPWPANVRIIVCPALAVAACSLFHNSGVLLAPAVLLALLPTAFGKSLFEKAKAAALFGAVSLAPYCIFWIRGFKAHASSGSKEFAPIFHRALERAPECIVSFGDLFVPLKPHFVFRAMDFLIGFALLAWMVWSVLSLFRNRQPQPAKESTSTPQATGQPLPAVVALALLFALAHYAVFSLVYEPGPLGGRYFWYLPLAIIGPLCIWIWQRRSPVLIVAFCMLLFAPKLWRSALFIRQSTVATNLAFPAYHGTIYPQYFLSSRSDANLPPGRIAILPPTFDWMRRWQPGPDENAQKLVHRRSP